MSVFSLRPVRAMSPGQIAWPPAGRHVKLGRKGRRQSSNMTCLYCSIKAPSLSSHNFETPLLLYTLGSQSWESGFERVKNDRKTVASNYHFNVVRACVRGSSSSVVFGLWQRNTATSVTPSQITVL
jgi:hypothetical protein